MRVRTEDVIVGYPALRVRALLRKWGPDARSPTLLAGELGIAMREAGKVMIAHEREGFVSRYEPRRGERVLR